MFSEKKTIEKLLDMSLNIMSKNFLEGGEVIPTIIICCEAGYVPVAFNFKDAQEKRNILMILRLLLAKHQAYAYSVCFEAWMKPLAPGDEVIAEIHDDPDKQEALMVAYCGHERRELITVPLYRNPNRLGKKMTFDGQVEGVFFDLLPPQHLIEKELTQEQEEKIDAALQIAKAMGINVETVPLTE